jgi:hypothetical protein
MTLTLKERARILALRVERDRRERIRNSNLVLPAGRSESPEDVRDLMGGYLSAADITNPGDESPEGYTIGRLRALKAHRPDEPFLIRDGKRRKATTYTDAPFPSGRVRNKARRLNVGLERLQALELAHGGRPEPMPQAGFKPCAPVDTMSHGRSTMTMRYRATSEAILRGRIALLNGERFDTITGEFIDDPE